MGLPMVEWKDVKLAGKMVDSKVRREVVDWDLLKVDLKGSAKAKLMEYWKAYD